MRGLQILGFVMAFLEFSLAVEPRVGIGDLNPKLAEEVEALKSTLASVQGTLVTSVALIQDQLDQFSKSMTNTMDARLSAIEGKITVIEDHSKKKFYNSLHY